MPLCFSDFLVSGSALVATPFLSAPPGWPFLSTCCLEAACEMEFHSCDSSGSCCPHPAPAPPTPGSLRPSICSKGPVASPGLANSGKGKCVLGPACWTYGMELSRAQARLEGSLPESVALCLHLRFIPQDPTVWFLFENIEITASRLRVFIDIWQ